MATKTRRHKVSRRIYYWYLSLCGSSCDRAFVVKKVYRHYLIYIALQPLEGEQLNLLLSYPGIPMGSFFASRAFGETQIV